MKEKRKRKFTLNFAQKIALAFLGIILLGACLLMLPFASKSGHSIGFMKALFTATSSVCVTGLSLVDIFTTFTPFGQAVMLVLIETGGLGFMTVISVIFYVTSHRINVPSLALMAEAIGVDGLKDITRIQKRLMIGSLIFELTGAVVLFSQFVQDFSIGRAAWFGLFHSVSAFCNAGFDLLGANTPGSSLITYNHNALVLVTVALLIVIGGIGFTVWDDILTSKKIRKWSVYTKLVIIASVSMIVIGFLLYFFLEKDNPATLGSMGMKDKLSNAFFQAVTPRTAGFAAVNQADLTGASNALTGLLMIIGGSAGSTAGGIKTITFVIVIVSLVQNIRGRKSVVLMHRTISQDQIAYAHTVFSGFIFVSMIGAFLVTVMSETGLGQNVYECLSAIATVGLSLGITSSVSTGSQIILIILMYIGRVGLLTLTLGFMKKQDDKDIKYPSVNLMIG